MTPTISPTDIRAADVIHDAKGSTRIRPESFDLPPRTRVTSDEGVSKLPTVITLYGAMELKVRHVLSDLSYTISACFVFSVDHDGTIDGQLEIARHLNIDLDYDFFTWYILHRIIRPLAMTAIDLLSVPTVNTSGPDVAIFMFRQGEPDETTDDAATDGGSDTESALCEMCSRCCF